MSTILLEACKHLEDLDAMRNFVAPLLSSYARDVFIQIEDAISLEKIVQVVTCTVAPGNVNLSAELAYIDQNALFKL